MILIINICKEKLHYYEFVKPIEDILKKEGIKSFTREYNLIKKNDLDNATNIIICGTSIYDNEFIEDISRFNFVKDINKPVLGICGGMQIIQLIFLSEKLGKINKKTEIGFYKENFKKEFLGLLGEQEVYHLHNNYVQTPSVFEVYSSSKDGKVAQAIKHKDLPIYGVLFHPEVRQKTLITNFCNL